MVAATPSAVRAAWMAILCGLAACASEARVCEPTFEHEGQVQGKGDVRGSDDRVERYQIESEPLRRAARATAATFFEGEDLYKDRVGKVFRGGSLVSATLETKEHLCKGQRFGDQPSLRHCSATLIGDDLMLTAGHCVDGTGGVCNFSVVFDYAYDAPPTDPLRVVAEIPYRNVYRCVEILGSEYERVGTKTTVDWALIRLDREVTGRTPVEVSWHDGAGPDEPVYLLGHPTGLPTKMSHGTVDPCAAVPGFYAHDADSFQVNSGGGLYDADGRLIGVTAFSNGHKFIERGDDGCSVVAVCGVDVPCPYKAHAYDVRSIRHRMPAELRRLLGIEERPRDPVGNRPPPVVEPPSVDD